SHALDHDAVTVEHADVAVREHLRDDRCRVAFVVMVAEHTQDRDIDAFQLADECFDLIGPAVRREVSDECEHVGFTVCFGERLAQCTGAGAEEVDDADGRKAQPPGLRMLPLRAGRTWAHVSAFQTSPAPMSLMTGKLAAASVASCRRSRKPHSLTSIENEKREMSVPAQTSGSPGSSSSRAMSSSWLRTQPGIRLRWPG